MTRTRCTLLTLLGLALLKWPVDALLAAATMNVAATCMAGAAATVLLLGFPAWRLRPWTSPRLMQSKSPWAGMGAGALLAVLCRMALTPVDAAWQGFLGITPEMLPVPEGLPTAMLYVLTLAVVPSIIEEMFFRGALLTGLLDGSKRVTAVLLTAVSFALMHGNTANLPSLLATSLVLTLLMLRTGRLSSAIAMHLVYNLTAFVWPGMPLWGSLLGGLMLLGGAVWCCVRRMKIAHPPMKKADGLIACAALAVLAAMYFV